MSTGTLSAAFREVFGSGALPSAADLEERLAALVAEARAAWPTLPNLPEEGFVRHLAERAAKIEGSDPLAAVRAADLWLAWATGRGDVAALAAFEATVIPRVRSAMNGARIPADVQEEVLQATRHDLFVDRGGRGPEIRDYLGKGPLVAWVRIMALRAATRSLEKSRREEAGPGPLVEALTALADPALEHVKAAHRGDFAVALGEAIASLSPRERNVLRYELLDGLGEEEIANLYGVHRTTVNRWANRARDALLSRTRRALMRRLDIDASEADSIIRLVRSRVDFSLGRLLK